MRKLAIIIILYTLLLAMAIYAKVVWFSAHPKTEVVNTVQPAEAAPSTETIALPAADVSEPAEPAPTMEVPVVDPTFADSLPTEETANPTEFVIADFDTGDKPNNLGGDFGAWNKDPDDATQSCNVSFETDDALKDPAGYSLKLDYDVDSPNPAYNGIWMKLNGQNASAYNTVSFYVRGEGLNNYTKRIKLELKDSAMNSSSYIVSGITDAWQKIEVPFDRFKKVKDWSSLGEFVVVFDDRNASPKQGTILIDQIAFEKK